jgi:hypothetical protein
VCGDRAGRRVLAAGLELADMHRDANRELGRHWPDKLGVCEGCGEPYPCAEEWITMRAIAGIESRWRREGQRLAEIPAAEGVAGDERQET